MRKTIFVSLLFLLILGVGKKSLHSEEVSSLSLKKKKPTNQVFLSSETKKEEVKEPEPIDLPSEKTETASSQEEEKRNFYLSQPVNYGTIETRIQRNSGQKNLPYRVKPRIVYSPFGRSTNQQRQNSHSQTSQTESGLPGAQVMSVLNPSTPATPNRSFKSPLSFINRNPQNQAQPQINSQNYSNYLLGPATGQSPNYNYYSSPPATAQAPFSAPTQSQPTTPYQQQQPQQPYLYQDAHSAYYPQVQAGSY